MTDMQEKLTLWHRAVFDRDGDALDTLLAEDVVFHAPLYLKPRKGKAAVRAVLETAISVFEDFAYHRELIDGNDWCLEFSARVGDLSLKGIDLIRFDTDGRMADFEVYIRPANALAAFGAKMAERMERSGVLGLVQKSG